jgi:FkbM family methyltransferase
MTRVILDVGANLGEFCIQQALANPNHYVLAFEPIPELSEGIRQQCRELEIKNLICYQVGIGNESKNAFLNISDVYSKGTSSFLDIKNELDQYWLERPDIAFARQIETTVLRLDEVLDKFEKEKSFSIAEISFIKIDTQGYDLSALESLGKYQELVLAGMLEAPVSTKGTIYDENYTVSDAMEALSKKFEIYKLKPNDEAMMEYNIYFNQVNIGLQFESELKLNLNPIYI